MSIDVAIIGGGLSGLACALSLREQGREPLILEASDEVGGRIRTDYHDGFLLDRGFQVLQTWYPEALPHALPMQAPPVHNPAEARLQQRQNVWSCGEYDSAPSIHWALHRGRRSAEELVAADR